MEHKLLVLCDPEEDYLQHMADFLRRKKPAPWEVVAYTKPEELLKFEKEIDILIISESAYGAFVETMAVKLPILLNESGVVQGQIPVNIDKYQEAEKVHQAIWSHYMEKEADELSELKTTSNTKFIGMYSPVRRCLQTTFALTYGQLLAEKHRTLYVSFEYYGQRQEWAESLEDGLSKLLYFLQEENHFLSHVRTVVQKVGKLDYVASMVNGQNLLYVTAQEWQKLLKQLAEIGEYEFIILDLNESMQGLFEVLRICSRVYTIIKEDSLAKCKVEQYEQLLSLQEYGDVKQKTVKYILPIFRKLPGNMEQFTKGELAEYVKELLYKEEIA